MPISVASPRNAAKLRAPLASLVKAALALEGRRPGEMTIVLSDDVALRALNRRWRGLDRATDVLSFTYDENESPASAPVNGDLVISLDRVRVQAKRFRVSEGEELARLVIHGALHLAGLDHARAAERMQMRAREDAALKQARAPVRALERALRR